MKNNNAKYLKAVLSHLGLFDGPTQVPKAVIEKAMSWAVGLNWSGEAYKSTPLQPVLETIKNRKSNKFIHPQPLGLIKEFFPKKEASDSNALLEQVNNLKDAIRKSEENQLLTALEYYASSIATHSSLSDIPLYDAVKIAASIAHCLENGNGKIRLAGGSISGIQTYLYDIISKRANKLLKSRSFYLQLLSDSLSDAMQEAFQLSPCHLVYSSGGGFYLLMPDDDEELTNKFQDFKTKVTKQIFGIHKANLRVEFALTDAFDERKPVGQVWKELLDKLNNSKLQQLSDNPSLLKDLLLGFAEEGGDAPRDRITNEEIESSVKPELLDDDDLASIVHPFTKAQIQLGRQLKDADYWITATSKFNQDAFEDPLGNWHLLTKSTPPKDTIVRRLNTPNPFLQSVFYGGNSFPAFDKDEIIDDVKFYKGEPKTFDVLAGKEGTFRRLGILRMDVDGLGKVFKDDIGQRPSFSRYAAVSRSLDWFFKGWLNEIQKPFKDSTLIVYSGGDDLFVVGNWKDVLEMAIKIQADFDEWSCGSLTISGGLSVLSAKFPVMQGAKVAGRAEDEAKDYRLTKNSPKEKNALSLFGKPISWTRDMPVLQDLKNTLLEMMKDDKMPESLLGKINIHASTQAEQVERNETPRWLWHMIYDFSRFEDTLRRRNSPHADKIIKLRDAAFADEANRAGKTPYHFITLLQIAARWVELERRSTGKD